MKEVTMPQLATDEVKRRHERYAESLNALAGVVRQHAHLTSTSSRAQLRAHELMVQGAKLLLDIALDEDGFDGPRRHSTHRRKEVSLGASAH
jgi:hypothetical protein